MLSGPRKVAANVCLGDTLSTTARSHSRNAAHSIHFDKVISRDQTISGRIPEWKLACLFAQSHCCV